MRTSRCINRLLIVAVINWISSLSIGIDNVNVSLIIETYLGHVDNRLLLLLLLLDQMQELLLLLLVKDLLSNRLS
jgi:hypothetical protein